MIVQLAAVLKPMFVRGGDLFGGRLIISAITRSQRFEFITRYAKQKPGRKDLAERALFACTMLKYPERIPNPECERIKWTIPNRMMYLAKLFSLD